MSIGIETDLKEILGQINQKLDKLDSKIDNVAKDVVDIKISTTRMEAELKGEIRTLDEKLTGQINTLDEKLTGQINTLDERLTGQINTLDEKVDGISKRLDTQEFINRSVVIGLLLAILGGFAKVFGLVGNP